MHIEPAGSVDSEPLSYAQQRLWFIDQLSEDSSHYNIPFAIRLRGRLKRAGLQSALDGVVQRHEVLRTSFSAVNGKVRLNVSASAAVPLPTLPVCRDQPDEQRIAHAIETEAHKPFDLSQGLMVRAALIPLADGDAADDHLLLITIHHIAADGWSLQLFIKELMTLYAAYCADSANPLPPLPLQYVDYAHWQRQRLQGEWFDAQRSYWQMQLDGIPPIHQLPLDRPRPARQSFDGAVHTCQLDGAMLHKLRQLGRRNHATLCMVAQAAFVVLLSRWSGQGDIVFGSALAGRDHPDVEPLIGLFVNTLVMRSIVYDDDTLEQVVCKVRDTALDAYDNQDIPFDILVDIVKPERRLSHSPVVQIMFSFPKVEATESQMAGIEITEVPMSFRRAKFDLELMVAENAAGLSVNWTYATSLFRQETIARVSAYFVEILVCMENDPRQCLRQLPPLPHHAPAAAPVQPASARFPDILPGTGPDTSAHATWMQVQQGRAGQGADHTLTALTDIWATILHRPAPGIGHHTSFFDVGGNSLSIIAVRAAITAKLGIPVSVADLFEHATLFDLSMFLSGRRGAQAPARAALQDAKARVLRARSIKLTR